MNNLTTELCQNTRFEVSRACISHITNGIWYEVYTKMDLKIIHALLYFYGIYIFLWRDF